MRPLELTLDGFRSYRTAQTFDFRDRRLVGIVGEIGAGKSSILDAIAFALYGKTPAIARETRSLIHQLRDECHVQLRFQVDGDIWQIQRALRRQGQAGHKLVRLDADSGDARELDPVTGDEPTKRRIHELLGMDFDAFCRSVLLAQNRFSEFLRARPADRDKVLKGVFGFERLDHAHGIAKHRLDEVAGTLASLTRDREHLARITGELAAARETASTADRHADRLGERSNEVEALQTDLAAAARERDQARTAFADLETVAARVPPEDEIAETAERAAGAASERDRARAATEEAVRARDAKERDLADLTARIGDLEALGSFAASVERHEGAARAVGAAEERVELAESAIDDAERLTEKAQAHAEAAAATFAERIGAVTDQREELARFENEQDAAHRAEMAHQLRSHVAVGTPCPVCDRPIEAKPARRTAPKTTAAAKAVKTASARLRKVETAAQKAQRQQVDAETELAAARSRLEAARATHGSAVSELKAARRQLTQLKETLVEHLGDGDPRTLLAERTELLQRAHRAADDAREAVASAHSEEQRVIQEATAARERVGSLATTIVGCWGRLGEMREAVVDPAELVDARRALVDGIDQRRSAVDQAAAAAAARVDAGGDRLAEIASELGLDDPSSFGEALAKAIAERAAARQRVHDLEEQLARGSELGAQIRDAETRRDLLQRLETDLRPSRFLAFLLEEERAELAELGSEHFEQLTAGAFRFSEDDRFEVRDMNAAGRTRRADSLSGGETFLASLALALALAEMVARGGGRLDAFFLDEGFGSLDPDHLSLAMEGIGRLVADDPERLVVLVSHVREMQESLEDLIELSKDPVTGDTRVLAGAALGAR